MVSRFGRFKHVLKRATLVTALAGSLFGGYLPPPANAGQEEGLRRGFVINGEEVAKSRKRDELEKKYSLDKIIHDSEKTTHVYYHSPERVAIIKEAFAKVPLASQRHISKIYICSPEDYMALCDTRDLNTAGVAYDDKMFINDHSRFGKEDLEHIVVHELSHVHENQVDPISGKDEKNPVYAKYFELLKAKHGKETTAMFMGLPSIAQKYEKEAKEIADEIAKLKDLPPSHYLATEWDNQIKDDSPPETILVRGRGFAWKEEYDRAIQLNAEVKVKDEEYNKRLNDFNNKYELFNKDYKIYTEKRSKGEPVPNELVDKLSSISTEYNNEANALNEQLKIFNELADRSNRQYQKVVLPKAGYVTPYATTQSVEDRAETAAFAILKPEIIRGVLKSEDKKGAELMTKKLELLHKYGYINSQTYKNLVGGK